MRGFPKFVSCAIVALNPVRFFGSDTNEQVRDEERVREKMRENERGGTYLRVCMRWISLKLRRRSAALSTGCSVPVGGP